MSNQSQETEKEKRDKFYPCEMGNCIPIFYVAVHPAESMCNVSNTPNLSNLTEYCNEPNSLISALTMEDDIRALSHRSLMSHASSCWQPFDTDQDLCLNPFQKSLSPSPLQSPASQGETFFDEEEFESEKELSTMTKQVIESCLQVLSDPSPKMSLLLAQVNRIELEREEAKRRAFSPRTAFHKSIRRQEVLQDIREEVRLAIIPQSD